MIAASQLLLDTFGDRGRHSRSAIGVAQLPGVATVEVELIVQVVEERASG
jgi:enamine deaminase RidA (YjgF/YER057c/UK114 family)